MAKKGSAAIRAYKSVGGSVAGAGSRKAAVAAGRQVRGSRLAKGQDPSTGQRIKASDIKSRGLNKMAPAQRQAIIKGSIQRGNKSIGAISKDIQGIMRAKRAGR